MECGSSSCRFGCFWDTDDARLRSFARLKNSQSGS